MIEFLLIIAIVCVVLALLGVAMFAIAMTLNTIDLNAPKGAKDFAYYQSKVRRMWKRGRRRRLA